MEIIKINKTRQQLEEAKDLKDVLNIRDISKAFQEYAKAAKLDRKTQNEVAELTLRSERKAGEMLDIIELQKNRYSTGNTMSLLDLNIKKHESARWQKLASISEEKFEVRIKEIKNKEDWLTQSSLLKYAENLKNEDKTINNEINDIFLTSYGENIYYESAIYKSARWDDHIIHDSDKWPGITTLSRFFHSDLTEYSLREYAKVQTFPDDFKFVGNYSSIKKQIGNAVAPTMSKYISNDLKGKTFGELFCGCGGFSLGLHENNKKCLWAIDWNEAALKTYKANFNDTKVINENVKFLNPKDFEKVDIIIGGPPCQGFSLAGERFKDDPRNELYKEFLKFIKILKPVEFIMENVPQIQEIKSEIINDFEKINYTVKTFLIKGEDIGMRQNRKRFFFKGFFNK